MVMGGIGDSRLDSTEILRPGSDWQEITTAKLPRPMSGVRVNNVDNRVLLTGEWLIMMILPHLTHTDPCYRGSTWRFQ